MKRTIIIAAIAFCFASCNNPSSPARSNMDSTSVNSNMNTNPGAMNNADTMNNSGTMNRDTMNNPTPTDTMPK